MGRYLIVTEPSGGRGLPRATILQAASARDAGDIARGRELRVKAVYGMGGGRLAGSWSETRDPSKSYLAAADFLKGLGMELRRNPDPETVLPRLAAQFPRGAKALNRAAGRVASGGSLVVAFEDEAAWLGEVPLEVLRAGQAHGRSAQACEEAAAVLKRHRPLGLRALLLTSNLWANALLYLPGLVLLGILAGVPTLVAVALTAPAAGGFGPAWARIQKRLPIVGEVFRTVTFSRFAQVFAALTRVGAPLARSVELAVLATDDADLAIEVLPRLASLREGEKLSAVLGQCERLPKQLVSFIATGESSGRLDNASEWLSEYLRDRAEVAVDRLTGHIAWAVPTMAGLIVFLFLLAGYLKHAQGLGIPLPSPGEMWHNLFHGPGGGSTTP